MVQTAPKNILIYLNDFTLLELDQNQTPSIPDIAYYLSSFSCVYTISYDKVTQATQYNNQIQIIQLAKSYNPTLQFYIYLNGDDIVDAAPPSASPTDQIDTLIQGVVANYNTTSSQTIQGIYYDNFEFDNIGAGSISLSGETFRDCQQEALSISKLNNLSFAFACRDYAYVTNLDFILNDTYNPSVKKNKLIFFDSSVTLVTYTLYGTDITITGSSIAGYNSSSDFFYQMMTINSILTNTYNRGLQTCLAIAAHSPNDYINGLFFTNAANVPVATPADGIAQNVFNLANWLSFTYIATSAYNDFYLSETVDLLNYIFPFDATNYPLRNALGKLYIVRQGLAAYKSNPTLNLSITGTNTASIIYNQSLNTLPITNS